MLMAPNKASFAESRLRDMTWSITGEAEGGLPFIYYVLLEYPIYTLSTTARAIILIPEILADS